MEDHIIHDELTGVFHTQGDHGKTVADEYYVHACVVGDVCGGEVVGGEHGDWCPTFSELLQVLDGYFLTL